MDERSDQLLVELAGELRGKYFGKYRGVVDDIDDDEGRGRLRAKVPSVFGDVVSPWAAPCVPFAGKKHGIVLLPEVGDGVWIEFEAGDPSRPIWSGTWWARDEMPDDGSDKGRALVTSNGLKLVLDEDANELRLEHAGGASITLKQEGITLSFSGKTIEIAREGISVNKTSLKVT